VEQQAAARNELLRDWYEQKQVQKERSREEWTRVGVAVAQGMQQFGADMQANAAAQQAASLQRMNRGSSTSIVTPNYIGGYNVQTIGPDGGSSSIITPNYTGGYNVQTIGP
jgi:hypothetical protein